MTSVCTDKLDYKSDSLSNSYHKIGEEIKEQSIDLFNKVFDKINELDDKQGFETVFSMVDNIRKGNMSVSFIQSLLCMTGIPHDQVHKISLLMRILQNDPSVSDEHDALIEFIVNETHDYWDYIKERDEERILNISNEQIREYGNDSFCKFGEMFFNNILHNRDKLFTKDFEESLWTQGDHIIRKVITYVHLRRNPKRNENGELEFKVRTDGIKSPLYQTSYASKLSVTKNASTWDVILY